MRKVFFLSVSAFLSMGTCLSQETIPLWSEDMPNHQKSEEVETQRNDNLLWIQNVQEPTLEVYLPTKQSATGRSVIICPGGGYSGLAYDWEGTDFAKWFNSKGITAFVLKYRLPVSKSVIEGRKAPLQDAQRAIKLVRYHAEKWGLSRDQIGIMGFSAGGHLASTLGTHYDKDKETMSGDIDAMSARPDFIVLAYPVITMKPEYTHQVSKKNLIGEQPDQEMVDFYSNELHVNKNTPPTFIVHAGNDKVVPVMNSILFYQALQREAIYSEMHIYHEGAHGFGLANGKGHLESWTDRLSDWIGSLK